MKDVIKLASALVLGIAIILAANFMGIEVYRYLGKRAANAEREVFTESTPYVLGKIQELHQMQFEYAKTVDPAAKAMMGQLIIKHAAELQPGQLPADLVVFVQSLKNNQPAFK